VLGYLVSLDDYYQLSNGLVMLQTTNHIYNTKLYDLVRAQSLFAWQRVRVANMMASSGQEWYHVIRMYNSGTLDSALSRVWAPVAKNRPIYFLAACSFLYFILSQFSIECV